MPPANRLGTVILGLTDYFMAHAPVKPGLTSRSGPEKVRRPTMALQVPFSAKNNRLVGIIFGLLRRQE